jgi:hypothetical protein
MAGEEEFSAPELYFVTVPREPADWLEDSPAPTVCGLLNSNCLMTHCSKEKYDGRD